MLTATAPPHRPVLGRVLRCALWALGAGLAVVAADTLLAEPAGATEVQEQESEQDAPAGLVGATSSPLATPAPTLPVPHALLPAVAPLAPALGPVVDAATPLTPLVEAANPVLRPVAETVVDTVAPVVAPVVGALGPVAESVADVTAPILGVVGGVVGGLGPTPSEAPPEADAPVDAAPGVTPSGPDSDAGGTAGAHASGPGTGGSGPSGTAPVTPFQAAAPAPQFGAAVLGTPAVPDDSVPAITAATFGGTGAPGGDARRAGLPGSGPFGVPPSAPAIAGAGASFSSSSASGAGPTASSAVLAAGVLGLHLARGGLLRDRELAVTCLALSPLRLPG